MPRSILRKGRPLIASAASFADNADTAAQRGKEECREE